MSTRTAPEALEAEVTVPVPPDEAFAVFTDGFGTWWPAEFSWSQPELLEAMVMDGRLDGMLTEVGPHGFRIDWGRIIAWDPPRALSFTWQIGPDRTPVPDPEQASRVHVTFEPAGDGTAVRVRHDDWANHGDAGHEYRDGFAQAWPMALAAYEQAVTARD
ncbi:MAG: SRPBCC domain-containing protein [Actinomycetota bacterium]|nr:SRPBCC domain-containing protein [Actinomycetota bacterium]